jgi:hypothetical protein
LKILYCEGPRKQRGTEPEQGVTCYGYSGSGRTRAKLANSLLHKYAVPNDDSSLKKKKKAEDVPLHATEALEGRESIAPTHS